MKSLILTPLAAALLSCGLVHVEQRDMPAILRRSYNMAFFSRHKREYEAQAAIHIAHGIQHDFLLLTPAENHRMVDARANAQYLVDFRKPPRIGPKMMLFGPHTGQAAWHLYQTIDWTHEHHDQTYDILSDPDIPWNKKANFTRDSVQWYLEKLKDTARSPAPLDVTLRRAAVMMKPYAMHFRNRYPQSATFFFFAHWWHPAIYEAMMIAGNGPEQDRAVAEAHALSAIVLKNRPQRMLLSRELMPRYSRMSPESANIFDNLHMLHGIAYDILAYPGWSTEQKRAELYRVIEAMSEHPGDRGLARRFPLPHPQVDPRCYQPWMRSVDGEMTRIMLEMLQEMWPMMDPAGERIAPQRVFRQAKLKMQPGLQPGELPGSLHDALKALIPNLKMNKDAMKAGVTNPQMTEMMLRGWFQKTGKLDPVKPLPMARPPQPFVARCEQTPSSVKEAAL